MYEQRYRFFFEAAHELGGNVGGGDHPYAQVHGHSFEVLLILRGAEVGPKGWLTDFALVKAEAEALRETLDHAFLNHIEGLEVPTLENIARYIFERSRAELGALAAVEVARPSLGESARYEP
jgi:6-pyruvoyltetrahydropterin/6-carboxytetrahydropterin synthase